MERAGPDRHPVTVAKNKKSIRKRWKKNTTYMAMWNARTLLQKGKLDSVDMEMNRLKSKILELAEMLWNGNGLSRKKASPSCIQGIMNIKMELVSLCTAVTLKASMESLNE